MSLKRFKQPLSVWFVVSLIVLITVMFKMHVAVVNYYYIVEKFGGDVMLEDSL